MFSLLQPEFLQQVTSRAFVPLDHVVPDPLLGHPLPSHHYLHHLPVKEYALLLHVNPQWIQ